ncbi:hypothetical protein IFR05_007051 [Cadophora sp. M221]|nr:hypothetical protein IFR05_007051 [Cadophora sp. M221]
MKFSGYNIALVALLTSGALSAPIQASPYAARSLTTADADVFYDKPASAARGLTTADADVFYDKPASAARGLTTADADVFYDKPASAARGLTSGDGA